MERSDGISQDPPDPTDQDLVRELEGLDLGSQQLLCIGSAADVFLCGAKVVKKVMRVSPSHFNNGEIEQGEDILLDYRKVNMVSPANTLCD
ncbi:hypothetical protein FRC08_011463 [Ceratobasidium sp. 394]|nr:hypothetical protein FRC08_011463 [Ceratobasidium sp. 394]